MLPFIVKENFIRRGDRVRCGNSLGGRSNRICGDGCTTFFRRGRLTRRKELVEERQVHHGGRSLGKTFLSERVALRTWRKGQNSCPMLVSVEELFESSIDKDVAVAQTSWRPRPRAALSHTLTTTTNTPHFF
jgi:hypothetical protein